MKIIFFSSSLELTDEWISTHNIIDSAVCSTTEKLTEEMLKNEEYVVVADYNSISSELNKFLSSGESIKNMIVLECAPEIATGKMLISRGVSAYGNTKMLPMHFTQMLETVSSGKVWTYPELTVKLVQKDKATKLNEDAQKLIENRLTPKETEVIYLILEGLTNDAISLKLKITTRTVKAHISSIFSKLHVSDRVSLVLLLK